MAAEPAVIRRCAILAGGWGFSVRRHVGRLARAYPDIDWNVFVHQPRRGTGDVARSQIRNLRRHGWRWVPYRLARALEAVFERLSPEPLSERPGGRYDDQALRALPNVAVHEVWDINAAGTGARVRELGVDLGIAVSAPILKARVFDAPRLGSLNIHRGRIPDYRGMPPGFWELHDGADAVGCTVHRVVERLDAGEILLETTIPVPPHATVRGVQVMLQEAGLELIVRAVALLRTGGAQWRTPEGSGPVRMRPPLALEAAVDRRLRGEHGLARRARRLVRTSLLSARNRLVGIPLRLVRGLFGRQHAVVLLYHRVNDDMRDELTTGIERFDQHLAWLRRHCRVVTIEDVVENRIPRHSLRPVVAITFDDGYRDNARYAAPLLEQHGVPAAFFVATGIVGTGHAFPHDLRRNRETIPAMDWDEVRGLRDAGFLVGSHTATHIDCGRAPLDEVRAELRRSQEDLRRELGLTRVLFAYPYGRRDNITPEARALVREMGFTGCLSAYGGSNGRVDPLDVRRKGIHHDFTVEGLSGRVHGRG